ncbi:H-NS histone family protein [Corticibacter populi]|uniref:H-NS histone family protein n=1 Tax=Corticibacter populi TaxID=1550736 RepID=A0A3M6QYU0_9BURK|nr:H-NS histone family protein [Corticibacter populi]RMX08195.1 H-NS histone family protein [Corticibacter populi]RZS35460.1 DNA-binding protein H-NS [Corticibacter populi]
MPQDFESLLAQRAELDRQIEALRAAEKANAIQKIRELVSQHELTESDIFGKSKSAKSTKIHVAPKYLNPETGETWTGRGRQPVWIRDKDPEQFRIAQ